MARPSDSERHIGSERRGLSMLAATLAVALGAVGVLSGGTYLLGTAAEPPRAAADGGGSGSEAASASPEASGPGGTAALGTASPSTSSILSPVPRPSASTKTTAATRTTRPSTLQTTNAGPETQVVNLVNSERAKAGCSALRVNSELTSAARGHSTDMATRDYFAHDTPEGVSVGTRVTNAGYRWSMVGENIAMGQQSAQSVMDAWMNSSGHRANILNCGYRDIGVGLAYNSADRPYWTQDFGTPL